MRHVNIPIFIPHLGCPNTCVFCNQRTISGVNEFVADDVEKNVEAVLSTLEDDDEVEIAFFGGSFTGIDRGLMTELLKKAYRYVESGRVKSIRCSTRPDYIDEEILSILKRYGVRVIELGLQSSCDRVLDLTKRGHSFEDEKRASGMIVDSGFELIGQMMIGLPGSTLSEELETAKFIIDAGASGARIYPTVVFCETELALMCKSGDYTPLSLEDAIERSAAVLAVFEKAGIPVIRIGLCSSDNLLSDKTYFAGPNHPSLGELVVNRFYLDRIIEEGKKIFLKKDDILIVSVSRGSLSKAVGQRRINKNKIKEFFGIKDLKIKEDPNIKGYAIKLERETEVQKCI